jgi:IS30 family transposase
MGRKYELLSLEDRSEIARFFANGSSIRQIAATLDRLPSTISRELKRNPGVRRDADCAPQARPAHGSLLLAPG